MTRTSAGNVASGASSFLCGSNNLASGASSFCGGEGSFASGYSAFSFGAFTGASGTYAVAFGRASAVSANSFALGFNARSDRNGQFSHANGSFANNGDAQFARFVLRNTTTNATPTTLFLGSEWNGAATVRFAIPSGKVFLFEAKIVGVKSDGTAAATYYRKGCIENVGGTTALVGTIETIGTDYEDNAATDIAITADNTNDALDISVTGIASETWRWVAVVEGVEVAYGT
jgi:hypothetical protein